MSDLINSIALSNIGPGKGKDFVSPTGDQFITAGPTREEIKARAPERGVMGAINDNVIEVANAAAGGVSSIANMVSPGNRVSKFIDEEIIKPGEASQSDQVKAEKKFLQQDLAGAEGAGEEITAYLGYMARNPGLAISQVAGSFAIPGIAAKGASTGARALGMGEKAASRFGLGATSAVSGAMAGGDAAGSAYDLVKRTPKKILEQNAEYQELVQTMSPEEALEEIATRAGRSASVLPGAVGAVLGPLGAERILAGAAKGRTGGRTMNALKTGGVDASTESFEEGLTTYEGQKAASQYNPTIDPMKGVAGAATAGAVMGAGPGLVAGFVEPEAAPNPLQPVVDQAQKPGSVLSRAVVSTGVADQTAAPPAAPGAAIDPISARVSAIETDLRDNATLEKIRGLTPDASSEFLYALNIAKNPGTRADLRDQAITQVEQVLETAKSGAAFTMVPPEKTEPSTALTVPGQQGGDLATRAGGPLAPNGMGQFFDPNTVDVDAVRVDNMLPGPRAIEGPRARIGTDVVAEPEVTSAPEQPAAAEPPVAAPIEANPVAESFAPERQQIVAPTTPAAPATPVVKPGAGGVFAGDPSLPAATRKRAGMLRQLADQGYETVERRGNEFFLKNSKTGQELKLDGMADSQLARKAIADSIRTAADQSPNSPRNDLKESTAAQNQAGNYAKPPVSLNGFSIRIENPQGSMRRGVDKDGVAWESEMKSDYGYIEGTKAKDGDGVDVLIGKRSDSGKIFVIDQVNEDGSFDEPKVVMGVTGEDQARSTYLSNYEKGWTGLGAITEMTRDQFNDWLKSGGPMKPTALGKKPAASKPAAAAPSEKARWIKAILDNSRLAGDTGIQLDVTPDGKLNFLGDPNSSKQGRSLLATLEEAKKAGATNKEIADAIIASKRSKAEIPAPQGQYATLEEAKAYLSQQRRSNGNVSGLPIQMADGSFGIAIKGSREYAEAERQRDQRDGASAAGKPQGEFFTVQDGGKQRKLKKVGKTGLPKKSSSQRPGAPRPISQDEASAIEQMAAILGKTVVFYETADDQGRLADGFVNPGQPGVIYVATETTVNPVAIFGHEFYHTLRETNPEAWNAVAAVVRKRVKDAKGFRADYYGNKAADERGDAELDMEQGGELEELMSDLGGNLMMDAGFWRDVFAQIQKDNGKDAKGIIARLAAAIEQMVARVMAAINQGGYNANDFVDDMPAIRAEFAKALAGHIQKAGISKSAMDAEIKKSVIRVSAEQKALQEFAEVDAQYRGTDQWMKAPNGRPSQLNERQWIQVRTPSFKTWFGDWEAFAAKQGGVWNDDKGEVSKAVDDNGEPLVVYHGTTSGGFTEFKKPGGTSRGDLGIFTTPNLEMARTYIKRGRGGEIQMPKVNLKQGELEDLGYEFVERDGKFEVISPDSFTIDDPKDEDFLAPTMARAVALANEHRLTDEGELSQAGYYASFVNIRNPYETDFEGAMWNGDRPEQWVVFNEEGETQYTKTGSQFFDSIEKAQDFASSLDGEAVVEAAPEHWETTDSAVRDARSGGNDGAIIRSVIDDGGGYSSYFNDPSDVFVALNPNQLKSATQNTGEFGKRTDDMRFSRDRDVSSDIDPNGFNEFTATPDEVAQADAYEAANGVRPYTSAGQLQVPIKLGQIRKSVKREGKYGNHPILDIPVNANGTVTLYFPTTNKDARRIVRERTLKGASGVDRVYLTNESGVAKVMANMGNIDQDVDGANVLVQIDPSLLQIDTEYEDGRKDFFIPIAEGAAFKGRMAQVKLFTQNAPRTKGLSKSTTINDITAGFGRAVEAFKKLTGVPRRQRLKEAKDLLRAEHNVGTLLSVNGKLEKTNTGGYGLNNYDGKDVMSMGLGLASAQKINDEQKLTTCPQSAICESLCLGETSGQNLLYGGEGQFRSGPRMSQYLKTEAMVQNPEDFAIVLFAEIDRLQKNARRDDYQATVRLNVTSDFPPKVFESIIKAFPDVMFYDYTKLNSATISPNHHLTYSSTGASQVVNGKTIVNPQTNWDAMVTKMNRGSNVAMAFTDKNSMPKFVVDGKTGQRFQVWDGDNYDARFLDPKREDGIGMIVGLTNKDRTTKPEMAAEKHNGFFVDYNPERDGDTVVIPDQEKLKSSKTSTIKVTRFSRDRDAYNQRIAALKDLITCLKK